MSRITLGSQATSRARSHGESFCGRAALGLGAVALLGAEPALAAPLTGAGSDLTAP